MTKFILSSIILLSFTACQEHKGPQPKTSKFIGELFSNTQSNTKEEEISSVINQPEQTNSENAVFVDIPMLENELPVLLTPVEI